MRLAGTGLGCDSPALVSPCGDLIAQTGAMLIDDPCIRFNSPGPRFPSQDPITGLFHPVLNGHNSDVGFDVPQNSVAASSNDNQPQNGRQLGFGQGSSCSMQQGQTVPLQSFQRSTSGMFPDWGMERASPSPEPVSSSPEHIHRPASSSVPYLQSELLRPGVNYGHLPLPTVSSTHIQSDSRNKWDLHRPESVFPTYGMTMFPSYDAGGTFGYTQPMHGHAATMQCQNTSILPAYSGAAPHAAHGNTAMEQLALSTAATADLLACMAANSSQASPAPGSRLILAASATIQAFARAAQSTHSAAVAQRGVAGGSAGGMLLTNPALYPHLPEEQRQQMAYLQQWQQRQQQLLPPHWNANNQH